MRFWKSLPLLLALTAAAQEETIVADRPGLADGATTLSARAVQIETGVNVESAGDTFTTLPTLLRIGLHDQLELRIESDVFGFMDGENDVAPVAVGVKYRFREQPFPLALIASIQPPSGGDAFGADGFDGSVRLVSDLELTGGFTLTPNAGVAIVEGEGAVAVVAASLERSFGDVTPFIDFEATGGGDDDASLIIDGGAAWLRGMTQLDVSVGFGVAGDSPDWFLSAGISRRF